LYHAIGYCGLWAAGIQWEQKAGKKAPDFLKEVLKSPVYWKMLVVKRAATGTEIACGSLGG